MLNNLTSMYSSAITATHNIFWLPVETINLVIANAHCYSLFKIIQLLKPDINRIFTYLTSCYIQMLQPSQRYCGMVWCQLFSDYIRCKWRMSLNCHCALLFILWNDPLVRSSFVTKNVYYDCNQIQVNTGYIDFTVVNNKK